MNGSISMTSVIHISARGDNGEVEVVEYANNVSFFISTIKHDMACIDAPCLKLLSFETTLKQIVLSLTLQRFSRSPIGNTWFEYILVNTELKCSVESLPGMKKRNASKRDQSN